MKSNNILIVEPDGLAASILRLYLEQHDFQVCQVTADAISGVEAAKKYRPDLLLTEVSTRREGDGIEAAGLVTRALGIPVVFASKYYSETLLRRMQWISPAGFLSKPLRETDLRATLFLALHSRSRRPQDMYPGSRLMVCEALKRTYHLTHAEANIVATIVQHPELRDVADALCISLSTVRTHLKSIFSKTGTRKQVALLHKVFTGPVSVYLGVCQECRKYYP